MALGQDRKSSVLTPIIRGVAAVLAVAVLGAGVPAVFVTENGTGAAALLAIGAAFLVIAVLGDRVKSVELGGVSLTIRDLARETYALAREAEHRGDDESADRLRAVAHELEALARGYRRLRGSMRSGHERTRALEPRLRDFEAALDAIDDSRSAFEQYHGLVSAEMMLPNLTASQRAQLQVVTERSSRSRRVRRDGDRRITGERLPAALRHA